MNHISFHYQETSGKQEKDHADQIQKYSSIEEYHSILPEMHQLNLEKMKIKKDMQKSGTTYSHNSTLTHSFTKYEVAEEAKCGIAGKEVAYCDNGCGETDEKEIKALEHLFLDYNYNDDATCEADGTKTAKCANGCGATNKIKAEGTKLDHVDGDGDYICDYGCGHIFEQPDIPDDPADDTCHMCGGKVHGNDIMSRISCFFAMIIRFVTEILTSVKK